ncbi:MAG TPA: hypothetical protein VFU15_16805 [Bacteroidia bacterium]|nr:hypothetical protein [Bacteroidia bacterium]
MKPEHKYRIVALLLAGIVFMSSSGFLLLAFLQTGIHRMYEYSRIGSEPSRTLCLGTQEFKSLGWIGEEDFIYKGKVYDMQSVSCANGKILVKCSPDNEETGIRKCVAQNLGADNSSSQQKLPVKDFFKIIPLFPVTGETGTTAVAVVTGFSYAPVELVQLHGAYTGIAVPPPDAA